MAENFYTLLTNIGKAKIANASVLGQKVNFNKLVLGDSNGNYYEPSESQETLVNKIWEGQVGNIKVDETNPDWIVVETVIPTSVGGFTIREAGLVDDAGQLLVVAKYPETYKPISTEGTVKDLIVRMVFEVSNASVVTLKIDPTVVLATKQDLIELDLRKASITTKDLTYYVNASTGLDTNDGLTSGTAFKTIQKAVDSVPDVLKHNVTINVADGTYSESIIINKVCSTSHYIMLNGNETSIGNVKITGLISNHDNSFLKINGVEGTYKEFIANRGKLLIQNCKNVVNDTSSNAIANSGNLYVGVNNTFSNKQAVILNNLAGTCEIASNISGEGNIYGVYSASGIVSIYNNAALATSSKGNFTIGGIITGIAPQRQKVVLNSEWESFEGDYSDCAYQKNAENQVTLNVSIKKKVGEFTAKVPFIVTQMPKGFSPSGKVCFTAEGNNSSGVCYVKAVLNKDGSLVLQSKEPLSAVGLTISYYV